MTQMENQQNELDLDNLGIEEPAVPQIVTDSLPEVAAIWDQLDESQQSNLKARLNKNVEANQQPNDSDENQGGELDLLAGPPEVDDWDYKQFKEDLLDLYDEGDTKGFVDHIVSAIGANRDVVRGIRASVSQNTESQLPLRVQNTLDRVPGTIPADIPVATKIIQSGRAKQIVDALKIAKEERGGAETPLGQPDARPRAGRIRKAQAASRHAVQAPAGTPEIPLGNNSWKNALVAAEEAERLANQ